MGAGRPGEHDDAATPSGQMPGVNGSPVGPGFRDGQGRLPDPHALRRLLLGLVPVLILVVVLLLTNQL